MLSQILSIACVSTQCPVLEAHKSIAIVCVFLLLSAAIFDILIHSYRNALSVFKESFFDWENPVIETNTRKEKNAFFIVCVCYFLQMRANL